jgi:hypothetical protein
VYEGKDQVMTRLLTAAALGALLIGSTASMAATPAAHTSAVPVTQINYAQRCAALSGQWNSVVDGHELSPNLGKAKADAAMGAKFCKSTTVSDQKRGASDYMDALKLIGVKPI